MMNYTLGRDEQELTLTVIRSEKVCDVYASDRTFMSRLDALCVQFPDVYKKTWVDGSIMGDGKPMGAKYQFPRDYLRFGKPPTEAQKAASREKAAKMNAKRGI